MTAHGFNHTAGIHSKDEWLTPPHIIEALGLFDLDPCAPIERPWDMAGEHYTIADDGLSMPWFRRVWCNPPYGRETFKWLARCAEHGNAIALIFARTETRGFHDEIWGKADAVFFFKGRISFHHADGTKGATANAPSCLVAYGGSNVRALYDSGLPGKVVDLRGQP